MNQRAEDLRPPGGVPRRCSSTASTGAFFYQQPAGKLTGLQVAALEFGEQGRRVLIGNGDHTLDFTATSPEGASYESPGQRPGTKSRKKIKALKGRNIMSLPVVISPLQGFHTPQHCFQGLRPWLSYLAPLGLAIQAALKGAGTIESRPCQSSSSVYPPYSCEMRVNSSSAERRLTSRRSL